MFLPEDQLVMNTTFKPYEKLLRDHSHMPPAWK